MRRKLTRPVLLIGSTDECPDIEYATGFRAPDPVIFLQKGKKRYLLVSELEIGRAKQTDNSIIVLTPGLIGLKGWKRGRMSEVVLRLLADLRIRSVAVPPAFPYAVARRLETAGIKLEIIKDPVFPRRAVKKPEEISKLKESQRAAVGAMRKAILMISKSTISRDGYLKTRGARLTSEIIKQTIAGALMDHNCQGRDTIVAGGTQAANPHETGHGPLKAGEAIVLDIFPRHMDHGYWGDLSRTVVKGKPSNELKKMYSAVKAAQAAALARIKPGVKCATIHKVAADTLQQKGFATSMVSGKPAGFFHSTGHGVGLAIHEPPAVGTGKETLKSGNIITVEPGLYYPETGGIRIEDTIVVVPGGWKYLASCEKKFEV